MSDMIVTVIMSIVFVACLIIAIKNARTYAMRSMLNDAIYRHHVVCIMDGDYEALYQVDYDDKEPYEATLFRLWDWGYSRILPKDKLEIIKPFIK